MKQLQKIKCMIEAQIRGTRECIADDKARLTKDSVYLKQHIAWMEARIDAWESTLEIVENEIMYAEKELEDLKIFQANTEATYFG